MPSIVLSKCVDLLKRCKTCTMSSLLFQDISLDVKPMRSNLLSLFVFPLFSSRGQWPIHESIAKGATHESGRISRLIIVTYRLSSILGDSTMFGFLLVFVSSSCCFLRMEPCHALWHLVCLVLFKCVCVISLHRPHTPTHLVLASFVHLWAQVRWDLPWEFNVCKERNGPPQREHG